ncbi:hypothetical protein E2C01_012211 [Portunus trituberculatus]|uniref:Uncharacterized protein n=1 Tax=Portunus trituberculatus TaxID=210409 RepID=A0A5B7DDJ1_PORTR|nr:hypothetical protein [Portunus trituberculatus]
MFYEINCSAGLAEMFLFFTLSYFLLRWLEEVAGAEKPLPLTLLLLECRVFHLYHCFLFLAPGFPSQPAHGAPPHPSLSRPLFRGVIIYLLGSRDLRPSLGNDRAPLKTASVVCRQAHHAQPCFLHGRCSSWPADHWTSLSSRYTHHILSNNPQRLQ